MIQMRMRQEYVAYRVDVGKFQVTDAGACVNQYIIVDQQRRRPRACADTATATQYTNSHWEGSLKLRRMG